MKHVSKCGIVAAMLLVAGSLGAQRAPVKLPPRPEPRPPKAFVYPNVTMDSLPNGLRFIVVENHELPLVVVRMAIAGAGPGGVWYTDPPGKPGAFAMLMASLREGTTMRSATQIRDELAELGVDMFLPAAIAFTPPWFRAPKSRWMPALDLVADMVQNATVPADGFARAQTASANAMDRMPPVSHSFRTMQAALYGPDNVNTQFATGASIRAVTRDEAFALKDKYLRPQNTTIAVVGDVTLAEARAALTRAFGTWERGGITVTPTVPKVPEPAPTTIYLKDSPGLAQTFVAAGVMLPSRVAADAAAAEALASVIGDAGATAGSRLNTTFRVERGLSYAMGVTQQTRPIPEPAPLVATLTVTPASTDSAVILLRRVFADLRGDRPPTAAELDFAKRAITGRVPADLERLDVAAFNILNSVMDRLPPGYLNRSMERINAVTLDEVRAAASRYIDPDHMPIIVVGDRAKLEPALRATGIPVVIVP